MYGSNEGATFMDPRGKSDFDAGILFFAALSRLYPGLQWADLHTPQQFMAGWLTDLKHSIGDLKDGVGDVLKDTASVTGKILGSGVRLAADPKVATTVTRAGAAYATGGGSELWQQLQDILTPEGQQVVTAAGESYKQSMGFNWKNPWVIGAGVGAAALLVVLVARK